MSKSNDNLRQKWDDNPEPKKTERDGSIILELNAVSDAYLWASRNSKEGWLSYNGRLEDIEQ